MDAAIRQLNAAVSSVTATGPAEEVTVTASCCVDGVDVNLSVKVPKAAPKAAAATPAATTTTATTATTATTTTTTTTTSESSSTSSTKNGAKSSSTSMEASLLRMLNGSASTLAIGVALRCNIIACMASAAAPQTAEAIASAAQCGLPYTQVILPALVAAGVVRASVSSTATAAPAPTAPAAPTTTAPAAAGAGAGAGTGTETGTSAATATTDTTSSSSGQLTGVADGSGAATYYTLLPEAAVLLQGPIGDMLLRLPALVTDAWPKIATCIEESADMSVGLPRALYDSFEPVAARQAEQLYASVLVDSILPSMPCYTTATRPAAAGAAPQVCLCDASCGSGKLAALLAAACPSAVVVALESDADAVASARTQATSAGAKNMRFDELDLADALAVLPDTCAWGAAVHHAFMFNSLHQYGDPNTVLHNLFALLKPGGHLSLFQKLQPVATDATFAHQFSEQLLYDAPVAMSVAGPGVLQRSQVTALLTKAGFTVTVLPTDWDTMGIAGSHFLCCKPATPAVPAAT